MSDDAEVVVRVINAAFEERVRDLFKVFAETVYTGEPERNAVTRFRRGLVSARSVRDAALAAAKDDGGGPT